MSLQFPSEKQLRGALFQEEESRLLRVIFQCVVESNALDTIATPLAPGKADRRWREFFNRFYDMMGNHYSKPDDVNEKKLNQLISTFKKRVVGLLLDLITEQGDIKATKQELAGKKDLTIEDWFQLVARIRHAGNAIKAATSDVEQQVTHEDGDYDCSQTGGNESGQDDGNNDPEVLDHQVESEHKENNHNARPEVEKHNQEGSNSDSDGGKEEKTASDSSVEALDVSPGWGEGKCKDFTDGDDVFHDDEYYNSTAGDREINRGRTNQSNEIENIPFYWGRTLGTWTEKSQLRKLVEAQRKQYQNYHLELHNCVQLGCFDFGKVISKGCYGWVFLLREKESRYLVALKTSEKSRNGKYHQDLERECAIQQRLSYHPNILLAHTCFKDDNRCYLVLDFAVTNMQRKLAYNSKFNESFAAFYIKEVATGLLHCHNSLVIHRDIKPGNILLGYDRRVKIADFGSAVVSSGSVPVEKEDEKNCTLFYMAPEFFNCKHYTKCVDIWSLGIMLCEFLHGNTPFQAYRNGSLDVDETISQITDHKKPLQFPPRFPIGPQSLIQDLLCTDPKQRMDLEHLLQDPWIRKHTR